MPYSDLAVEDMDQADTSSKPLDPQLLAEARIKARKLREFVKETMDENDWADEAVSHALIRDYNGLRALVVEASPGQSASLPPEVPISDSGSSTPHGPGVVTFRELCFFCDQIKEFLDRWAEGGPVPRLDNGASLFGPAGLEHDPALLAAARVKAQTLLDFVEGPTSPFFRIPVTLVEDYNRLLALIREAAPGLESVLPGEIHIPADPKPRPEDEPAPSFASRFLGFLNRDERPGTPKYNDFLYHCRQIARLLK